MTDLEAAIRALDEYAGAAGDIEPPVGNIAVPVRMFVALRKARRAAREGTK